MSYCCKEMKEADEKEWIDYCEPNSVDLEFEKWCVPINYCPFCGIKFKSAGKVEKAIKEALKEIGCKKEVK